VLGVIIMTAVAVALPPPSFAQPKPVPIAEARAKEFNVEQLDAMLAGGLDLSITGHRHFALA
jgi:hypothetical protein